MLEVIEVIAKVKNSTLSILKQSFTAYCVKRKNIAYVAPLPVYRRG